jgi:hypothetical protein
VNAVERTGDHVGTTVGSAPLGTDGLRSLHSRCARHPSVPPGTSRVVPMIHGPYYYDAR